MNLKALTLVLLNVFTGIGAFSQIQNNFSIDTKDAVLDSAFYYKRLNQFSGKTIQIVGSNAAQYKALEPSIKHPIVPLDTQIKIVYGIEKKQLIPILKIPAFKKNSNGALQQLKQLNLDINITEQAAQKANPNTSKMKTALSSSVLANGTWQKISLVNRGVYKIDYDFVKNVLGQTGSLESNKIRLFGNGGTMLYESNAIPRYDDLVENAIEMHDGGDGIFGTGDYFLFYANGPMEWVKDSIRQQFHHRTNLYADSSYYFINFNEAVGKRIQNASQPSAPINTTVSTFNDYRLHETDLVNLGNFGKVWWGEKLGYGAGQVNTLNIAFNDVNSLDTVFYAYNMANAAIGILSASQFTLQLNGTVFDSKTGIGGITGEDGDDPAQIVNGSGYLKLGNTKDHNFFIEYTNSGSSNAKAYLDFIETNYRCALNFQTGHQLSFRDWNSVGAATIANFEIATTSNQARVWDVSQPLEVQNISSSFNGSTLSFKQSCERLKEYIVFDNVYLQPYYAGIIANQDLHALSQANYLIIYHPEMKTAAEKLADYHRNTQGLSVHTVDVNLIYNEFGSGAKDISAIRDFIKMFYDRAGTDTLQMPKYVLLMGQASFDYKNKMPGNPKLVPTFETAESTNAVDGYCTDDFYAILDSTEDINQGMPLLDIAIGRLPVTNSTEANALVDKIIRYKSKESFGPWRLNNLFIGDNEDGAGDHLVDADSISKLVQAKEPFYKAQKVYLNSLPFVSTPGGYRCPEANKIINDNVKKGTFLINYNGHGSIYTLAHERVVTQEDYNSWVNPYKLPFMITATCDFSRFDNPSLQSAGEKIILKSDGGAIALITTTQVVFANSSFLLNSAYLNAQFSKTSNGWHSFGDAFTIGKNSAPSTNTRKFSLLGDPALMPNFPRYDIQTDSIFNNQGALYVAADTIKSLGTYKIYASIRDDANQVMSNFNGKANVTLYDKAQNLNVVTNNSGSMGRDYKVQNNIIFQGNFSVENGVFSFEFICPKDINYDFGNAKIVYYADNGQTDAAGTDLSKTVGGFSDYTTIEEEGPVIRPFMNDSLFKDGGLTGNQSVLFAIITDSSGINVSGNYVGHDLVGVLDGDEKNPFIMNDYYETAPNTYKKGYLSYPVNNLSNGFHQIKITAWDVFNNSGEATVHFEVLNGELVKIRKIYSYPNPFSASTHFVFEHNHPNETLNAIIHIYNSMGSLIRIINQSFTASGSNSHELSWDGTDNSGAKLPSGIYPYRIRIATEKNIEDLGYQKVILLR